MRNYLTLEKIYRLLKCLVPGIFSCFLLNQTDAIAQVSFTQTTDADFNKGTFDNTLCVNNDITMQFSASDPGLWWTGTSFLPQPLTGHKTATANYKYVYLVGGYNGTDYSSGVYLATIQTAGISGWTAMNPLPVALRDPAVVVASNVIYVLGGRNATQVFNTVFYANINPDGTLGAWQTSGITLPDNLWGHSAVYLNGHIYVSGGSNVLSETAALGDVYIGSLQADNTIAGFTAETSLPANRTMHGMVTCNNKIYVTGGYDNSGAKTNTVFYTVPDVNGTTGAWMEDATLPVSLSNHSTVVSNGLLMVIGGSTPTSLSNSVYYAGIDGGATLTWTASPNQMFDYLKDGSAFPANGQVIYTGGISQAGNILSNCRYANLTLTANYVKNGIFVSSPFFDLGAERLINTLAFTAAFNSSFANCQISYRTAGSDKIWSAWSSVTSTTPITVNLNQRYLQYEVFFTSQNSYGVTLSDVKITTPGTPLSGNLNAITTFTAAASPYVVFSNISFTAGTHTFQAGTTVLFMPGTGMSVSQSSLVCNGTETDSVKFSFQGEKPQQWNGIYFDANSDVGVSSQFFYTVIEGAGYGSYNANLYCNQTTQPFLSHCSIRNADGNGIRLNSSDPSLQNTSITGNSENGMNLDNSNPAVTVCSISDNGGAGIYANSTASILNGTTINHNLYGIRYKSPNLSISQPVGSPTLTSNTYNGISVDGGDITTSNKTWSFLPYPYFILGNVRIGQSSSFVRLTIKAGNTLKVTGGAQIQVGYSDYGGELYAIGAADSLITFTSLNGLPGGWNGIYFSNYSDNWGGHSQLGYCIIENGNDYNYYSEYTIQPDQVSYCKIQNALTDGARYVNSGSSGSINNCQFLNNGRYPLYLMSVTTDPVHANNYYNGNAINYIALSGGDYTNNVTFYNDGIPYHVLDNITIRKSNDHARITIKPGVTLAFAPGKNLQVGYSYIGSFYGGDLYAEGKEDSIITFKPFDDTIGGWGGIYFTPYSDDYGSTSSMKYCKIEKGASYNVYCSSTTQPSVFDHCVFDSSAGNGINLSSYSGSLTSCTISNSVAIGLNATYSSGSLHNCRFIDNKNYPVKYNDWNCDFHLEGNLYSGNAPDYIALSGGDYSSDRIIYNDGIPYHVLDNITIRKSNDHARITIKPGVTLAFAPGKNLQVGYSYSGSFYGGDLYAEGKEDSIITFKPFDDTIGGWGGIYFTSYSNDYGSTSSMKYCKIEKGASYNVYCSSTTQPSVFDHCVFDSSAGDGLKLSSSTLNIRNSAFTRNTSNGIILEGNSNPVIGNDAAFTCNLYYNGASNLRNNTSNTINAQYNFWASADSASISSKIYDKYESGSLGIVQFVPFASLPGLLTELTELTGTVTYGTSVTSPMSNADVAIKNNADETIASTVTDNNGVFSAGIYPSGNYRLFVTPADDWGGVNGTDALRILQHFTQITPLSEMELAVGDVNKSGYVNGTDALLVKLRFVGLITSFASGDYFVHYDTIIVNDNHVTGNIRMLWFGDVNGSFIPTLKKASFIRLTQESDLSIPSFTEFNLPVKIKVGKEISAISLGFYYPEQYFEITGVELPGGNKNFAYSAQNGLFRLAWADVNPMIVKDQEAILILKMKSGNLAGLPDQSILRLLEHSEFADKSGDFIDGIELTIPRLLLSTAVTGINTGEFSLNLYPNPCREFALIGFNVSAESRVKMTLYNNIGTEMHRINVASYPTGYHHVRLNTSSLTSGMYLLKTEITSGSQTLVNSTKVVISH